jgi:nitrous oxidase accessory protein NosD
MLLRRFPVLLAVAVFATATAADARVRVVQPGESIQAAIDAASPGDTILVRPGVYQETGNTQFGLRISTPNLRLIGKLGRGQTQGVRLVAYGTQQTGVYAAPAGCGPEVPVGGCAEELEGFEIRGFAVEDFPRHGIQTRFVNDFKIIGNESARNLENGIYPTISANGLVQNNVSYGALDTAMWVAASENVRVVGNELRDSVIGFEISVANEVQVNNNIIKNNSVGVALIHPNGAGNAQLPVMANWVIEDNWIYSNNLPNMAPPGTFQAELPSGVGVLLLGVSNNVITRNKVKNNDFVGIGVLGWCTAVGFAPGRTCFADPPQADPAANDNLVYENYVLGNGLNPPGGILDFLAADISYLQYEASSGNCFYDNGPEGFTYYANTFDGELPTDCE